MRLTYLLAAAVLAAAACQPGAPAGGGEPRPEVSVDVEAGADSVFRSVRRRLLAQGYRVDQADADARRLVVRPADDEARVEIRIVARGSASRVHALPAGGADGAAQMRALLSVMHASTPEPAAEGGAPGGLPDSQWITELFLSPRGRLWSARTGLFTADSLFGPWRRSFGARGDPVDPDQLRVGAKLAFVSEEVMVLGVEGEGWKNRELLYRSTDGGASWSAVRGATFEEVDAVAPAGSSVWVFATRVEGEGRHPVFLRSADGGASWERAPLPPGIRNATELYRLTPDTAYLAASPHEPGPVFWRTDDGGGHWTPVPTPHDRRLHRVPDNGVRIDEIATVGDRLVVVEYGRAFQSRRDSIHWREMEGIAHVAADRARDRLFVLSGRFEPAMLDRDLNPVWRGDQRLRLRDPSDLEAVLAHDDVGYAVLTRGEIYEVRGGKVRVRRK